MALICAYIFLIAPLCVNTALLDIALIMRYTI